MDYGSVSEHFFKSVTVIGGVFLLIVLVLSIVYIIGLWKVYEKADKPGWACIVPFYGNWVLTEIAGLHWMYFVFMCANSIVSLLEIEELSLIATLISLYASFVCAYNISKKFNKGIGFSICLFFFGVIVYPILGFSKNCQYDASIPVSEHGVFGESNFSQSNNINNINNVDNSNHSYCGNCGMKISNDVRFCPNCGKEKL